MDRASSGQQWNLSPWQVQGLRSHVVLLLALLVALSNPLACLLHCWVHSHTAPLRTAPTALDAHAHAHHIVHTTVAAPTVEKSSQTPGIAAETFCRSDHQTPSPFTVAVLLSLLLVTFWIAPGFPLPVNSLFFLLPAYPPPRRPPRFAATTTE